MSSSVGDTMRATGNNVATSTSHVDPLQTVPEERHKRGGGNNDAGKGGGEFYVGGGARLWVPFLAGGRRAM